MIDKLGAAFACVLISGWAAYSAAVEQRHPVAGLASMFTLLTAEVARLAFFVFAPKHAAWRPQWEARMAMGIWLGQCMNILFFKLPRIPRFTILAMCFMSILTQSFVRPFWHPTAVLAVAELQAAIRCAFYQHTVPAHERWTLFLQFQTATVLLPWLCHFLQARVKRGRPPLMIRQSDESTSTPVFKPYVSLFRRQAPILIVIPDPYQVHHLPPGALKQVQQDVQKALSRSGQLLEVVDIAVRSGCILALIDLIRLVEAGALGADVDAAEVVKCIAEQLPELMNGLAQAGEDERNSDGMHTDKQLYVQLGDQRACLTWSAQQGRWDCVIDRMQPADYLADPPELGLVLVSPQPAAASSQTPQPAGSSSAGARAAGAVTSLCSAGEVCWLLQVQLWCDGEAGRAGQWQVQGSDPHLYATPSASTPPAGDSGMCCLQLWALGGTGYLRTHVLSCVPGRKQQGQDTGCTIMEVLVCASRDQLLCHHHGGPPLVVQPVALQLWNGDYWLHTSQSLLCVQQVAQGRDLVQDSCSWWGASSVDTCACVEELHALTHSLWQHDAAREEVTGHQLLLRDMAYWLSAVQQAAHEQAWCVCERAEGPTDTHSQVGPTASPAAGLGSHLLQYTARNSLAHTHVLLQAQRACISRTRSPASIKLCQLFQRVRSSLFGFSCPHCEQLFSAQVHHHLSMVRACSCLICVLMPMIVVAQEFNTAAAPMAHLLFACACLNLAMLYYAGTSSSTDTSRHVGVFSVLSILAFLLRCLGYALMGLGVFVKPHLIQRQSELGTWVVSNLVLQSVGVLHLQAAVPQPVLACFCALQGVLIYCTACNPNHSWVFNLTGSVLVSVVVPLMVDMHIRQWVMASVKAGKGAAAPVVPSQQLKQQQPLPTNGSGAGKPPDKVL